MDLVSGTIEGCDIDGAQLVATDGGPRITLKFLDKD